VGDSVSTLRNTSVVSQSGVVSENHVAPRVAGTELLLRQRRDQPHDESTESAVQPCTRTIGGPVPV
jgi:hypothetical protein